MRTDSHDAFESALQVKTADAKMRRQIGEVDRLRVTRVQKTTNTLC